MDRRGKGQRVVQSVSNLAKQSAPCQLHCGGAILSSMQFISSVHTELKKCSEHWTVWRALSFILRFEAGEQLMLRCIAKSWASPSQDPQPTLRSQLENLTRHHPLSYFSSFRRGLWGWLNLILDEVNVRFEFWKINQPNCALVDSQIGRILPCLQSGKDWKGNPETTGHAKDQSFGFQGLQDFLPSAH